MHVMQHDEKLLPALPLWHACTARAQARGWGWSACSRPTSESVLVAASPRAHVKIKSSRQAFRLSAVFFLNLALSPGCHLLHLLDGGEAWFCRAVVLPRQKHQKSSSSLLSARQSGHAGPPSTASASEVNTKKLRHITPPHKERSRKRHEKKSFLQRSGERSGAAPEDAAHVHTRLRSNAADHLELHDDVRDHEEDARRRSSREGGRRHREENAELRASFLARERPPDAVVGRDRERAQGQAGSFEELATGTAADEHLAGKVFLLNMLFFKNHWTLWCPLADESSKSGASIESCGNAPKHGSAVTGLDEGSSFAEKQSKGRETGRAAASDHTGSQHADSDAPSKFGFVLYKNMILGAKSAGPWCRSEADAKTVRCLAAKSSAADSIKSDDTVYAREVGTDEVEKECLKWTLQGGEFSDECAGDYGDRYVHQISVRGRDSSPGLCLDAPLGAGKDPGNLRVHECRGQFHADWGRGHKYGYNGDRNASPLREERRDQLWDFRILDRGGLHVDVDSCDPGKQKEPEDEATTGPEDEAGSGDGATAAANSGATASQNNPSGVNAPAGSGAVVPPSGGGSPAAQQKQSGWWGFFQRLKPYQIIIIAASAGAALLVLGLIIGCCCCGKCRCSCCKKQQKERPGASPNTLYIVRASASRDASGASASSDTSRGGGAGGDLLTMEADSEQEDPLSVQDDEDNMMSSTGGASASVVSGIDAYQSTQPLLHTAADEDPVSEQPKIKSVQHTGSAVEQQRRARPVEKKAAAAKKKTMKKTKSGVATGTDSPTGAGRDSPEDESESSRTTFDALVSQGPAAVRKNRRGSVVATLNLQSAAPAAAGLARDSSHVSLGRESLKGKKKAKTGAKKGAQKNKASSSSRSSSRRSRSATSATSGSLKPVTATVAASGNSLSSRLVRPSLQLNSQLQPSSSSEEQTQMLSAVGGGGALQHAARGPLSDVEKVEKVERIQLQRTSTTETKKGNKPRDSSRGKDKPRDTSVKSKKKQQKIKSSRASSIKSTVEAPPSEDDDASGFLPVANARKSSAGDQDDATSTTETKKSKPRDSAKPKAKGKDKPTPRDSVRKMQLKIKSTLALASTSSMKSTIEAAPPQDDNAKKSSAESDAATSTTEMKTDKPRDSARELKDKPRDSVRKKPKKRKSGLASSMKSTVEAAAPPPQDDNAKKSKAEDDTSSSPMVGSVMSFGGAMSFGPAPSS